MKLIKIFLLLIFTVSTFILIYINVEYSNILIDKSATSGNQISIDKIDAISFSSIVTSITSLLALIITSIFTWRKDKREKLSHQLEIKSKELEIDELRMKLDKKT